MIESILILILICAPIAKGAVSMWAYGPIYIFTLIAFVLCVFKLFSSEEISIKRTPLDIPVLLFFFLSIVTTFGSGYIYGSVLEIIKFANLALIFYIIVNFINTETRIKRILNAVLIIGSATALIGIFQYLGVVGRPWWDKPAFLSATYVNHNHFAGLMELTIPLSIGMMLSERDKGKKSLYLYSFLLLCVAFLLSMSRGAWLSLLVSMVFMGVMIIRKHKLQPVLFISALFLITAGIFVFKAGYIDAVSQRVSSYRELDFSGRIDLWKGTLGIIKDNWLLGTGPGTFIYNFPKYRPAGLNMFANYAHNDYLQIFSEMGIFALAILVFIIAVIIRKGLCTYSLAHTSFKQWISLSLVTGILSLSLHGLGDFNFYIPANAILFTVFAAFIFSVHSRKEKECPALRLRPDFFLYKFFKPAAFITVIALAIFILASVSAEICLALSDNAVSRKEFNKAESFMDTASILCPFNCAYRSKLARIYYIKDRNEMSAQKYKEALSLNPLDSWSWLGLAETYYKLHRSYPLERVFSRSALYSYGRALELDPLNSYYLKRFSGFLLNIGDSSLSGQMYKKAASIMLKSRSLSLFPAIFAKADSYKEIADMAFYGQDINKALIFYGVAEELDQKDEDATLGQIRCYLKMSLMKEALRKSKGLKASRHNRSVVFASLGEYYLRKGDVVSAERFAERSIAAFPGNPEGYQLKYKISRRLDRNSYPGKEISRILSFNSFPVSMVSEPGFLEFNLDVEKRWHKNGKESIDVVLPAGIYEFKIKAKGEKALQEWPRMIVRFNNKKAMDTYVNDENWKIYSGIVVVDYPLNRFEIVYDNDFYDTETKEDRNLVMSGLKFRLLY